MKNTTRLILIFQLLTFDALTAQIEAKFLNTSDFDVSRRPLSIKADFERFDATISIFNNALLTPNADKLKINLKSEASITALLTPSETFNKQRFWSLVGASATSYTGAVLLLDKVWYAQYPREGFHYFNDSGEWELMDKAGHVLTTYTEAKWVYNAMRWSGMKNRNAALMGVSTGMVFQTTLEILDGFSTEWGFSWADMAANTGGAALFGVQQAVWDEQRILLKISNTPRTYSDAPIRSTDGLKTSSLRARTDDLYGNNYTQTFFKDYNALTVWLSVNPRSFNKNGHFPTWLNIAVGYGADNMFGGYNNQWPTSKPEFVAAEKDFPRYRQFYLSLDIDLSKIKTKSKALNAVLRTINFIKIPSPTLEFNSLNQVKGHFLFF